MSPMAAVCKHGMLVLNYRPCLLKDHFDAQQLSQKTEPCNALHLKAELA